MGNLVFQEQKARQDEEAKLQRKLDAQKTFEAWLKNKESEKKGFPARKKALSPTPNDEVSAPKYASMHAALDNARHVLQPALN